MDNKNAISPWRRYFARLIDMKLFIILCAFLFVIPLRINPSQNTSILFSLACTLAWVPIEAFFLSRYGFTAGKFLLGLKVLDLELKRITYKNALKRSLNLYIWGIFFGFPLLTLIFQLWSGYELKKQGLTSWDKNNNTIVSSSSLKPLYVCLFILLGLITFLIEQLNSLWLQKLLRLGT